MDDLLTTLSIGRRHRLVAGLVGNGRSELVVAFRQRAVVDVCVVVVGRAGGPQRDPRPPCWRQPPQLDRAAVCHARRPIGGAYGDTPWITWLLGLEHGEFGRRLIELEIQRVL